MKLLFSSLNIAEVGLLKTLIEQEGIACLMRNERLSMALGEVPFLDAAPELWVFDDADYQAAQTLVARWKNAPLTTFAAWICPDCATENEGQFGACWKCGHEIDSAL